MLETEKSRITVFFFDIDILLAGSQLHSVTTQCALQRPSRLLTRCCWLPPTRTCCRRPRWSRPGVVEWPPGSTPKRWRRRQCRLRCGTRSSSGVMCGSSVCGAEGLAGMRHRALASVCIYLPSPHHYTHGVPTSSGPLPSTASSPTFLLYCIHKVNKMQHVQFPDSAWSSLFLFCVVALLSVLSNAHS